LYRSRKGADTIRRYNVSRLWHLALTAKVTKS